MAADKGCHSCINKVEIQKHFEFYGKSYDDLNHFKDEANAELRKLKSHLNAIDEQVETIANSIEESRQYSYKYNLKITGIPQLNSRESAVETTQLCINLFNKLRVDVHQYDIDIAHRVSVRGASAGPKPIICKLVRRVVKEQIMEVHKRITDFQAGDICSELNGSLENARVFNHLTPNIQRLLAETKVYQRQQNYRNGYRKLSTNGFPFNHLDDNSFNLAIYELAHGPLNYNNDLFELLLCNPIDESPIASTFPFNIDPDSNLSFNMSVSEYMVEEAFADSTAKPNINFTLMYLNAWSLLGNFDNFKHLLINLRTSVSVIRVSETWLNELTCDQVNIPEYNFVSNHRSSKIGGGVGLYLHNNLKYKMLPNVIFQIQML
ncbi:Hypothetical predicted protein [Paramuricea clavata]|uniref:Uncharacterized protein n=1 Tax=Paramuricea clavata TaxID=317549 RepID=A0A7D9HTL0_PARCT|nr:Hypothetical predicted protein [Paramuricea clavata]